MAAFLGILSTAVVTLSAFAQDNPCTAGGKVYESGKMVCMRGFVQQCVNGSWANQQRFCSEDTQFEVIREPDVAVPDAGTANQPAVPSADNPSQVVVPPPQ